MPFLFGFMRCLRFFNPFENPGVPIFDKLLGQKWKGLLSFFSGIVLVLMRWAIIGMILECYGMVVLFGSYFPMLLSLIRQVVTCETDKVQVPIIGKYVDGIPYLKDFAASAAKQAPKYPAVQLTNICYQLHLLFHVSYWLSLFILHFQDGTEYDGLHLYSAQREHFQIQVH